MMVGKKVKIKEEKGSHGGSLNRKNGFKECITVYILLLN